LRDVVESITPEQFHESQGVDDWRVLENEASANFRSGSFARGVEFIDAIRVLADGANHHPDIDLRYASVTVRLTTHEIKGLSERDVSLAREISDLAREMDIQSEPIE
jgi:4a-hydroxytetrahydrobiopterin dehydratase